RSNPKSEIENPKSLEEALHGLPEVERHGLQLFDGQLQVDGDDLVALEGGHLAEVPLLDQLGAFDAQAGSEHAVEHGGGAAPLDVAEDHRARFGADAPLDLPGDEVADASLAQDDVAKGVDTDVVGVGDGDIDPLGGDHQAPLPAALPLAGEVAAHLVEVQ